MNLRQIRRGDIYYADLAPVVGSEQERNRPVLVIQNDIGNRYSPTIITAIITGQVKSKYLPTHVLLTALDCSLPRDSMVMLEQLRPWIKAVFKNTLGILLKLKCMKLMLHCVSASDLNIHTI